MIEKLLLGLDIGTSGVKAVLVDKSGRLLGIGRASHENETPYPGWVQCDPEKWRRGICDALSCACAEAGVQPNQVTAIGVSTLFPAIIPLDRDGRGIYPAILYCDRRSSSQVQVIAQAIPQQQYEAIIGNKLIPGTCAVTSLAWLRDEQPEIYTSASLFGFANTYLLGHFTGHYITDPTTASLSGLTEIEDPWQWSEDLCERLGIDRGRLPEIKSSMEVVGEVTTEAERQTGLRAGTPVVCGCGDAIASVVGFGATVNQQVLCVTGSTDCIVVPSDRPTQDLRLVNIAYIPRGWWVLNGAMTSTGVSIDWFIREILGERGASGASAMTELVSHAPPGSHGVLYLPYLQGERTPVWDPKATGIFYGLSADTTRADLARAVFEGIAFAWRQVLEIMEESLGRRVDEISVVGGATKNMLWNQIKADVLQRQLSIVEMQEASALGAAMLAGIGAGIYQSFEEAMQWLREGHRVSIVRPDPKLSKRYEISYRAYQKLYPATKDI